MPPMDQTPPQRSDRFRLFQGALVLVFIACAFIALDLSKPAAAVTHQKPAGASPDILGTSAYLLDLTTGRVLYAKHADAQLPIASITKLFTVAAVSEVLPEDAIVRVSSEAVLRGEGGLAAGEEWRMRDLADFTLIVSSNVGAEALAEAADPYFTQYRYAEQPTIERMNALAREAGLQNTYFMNASGLDISPTQASAMSSARDIAHFMKYLYGRTDLFSETTEHSGDFKPLNAETIYAENTNDALPDIPGLIFGKTGYTDLAGGTLAVLFELGPARPVAAVVLGSTREARFEDMRTLIDLATKAPAD